MSEKANNTPNLDELKEKLKVGIVDTGDYLNQQAKDIAEEEILSSKEQLSGVKGVLKKIWKHGLFEEYYRQKAIAKVKSRIASSKNFYEDEDDGRSSHTEAMSAVVDRFVNEYEESLHQGETREGIDTQSSAEDIGFKDKVKDLIKDFCEEKIDKNIFIAEKNRLVAQYNNESDLDESDLKYVDNILDVALNAKTAVEHGVAMSEIDELITFTKGKARLGVRTSANLTNVDRLVEKVQKLSKGLVNETTVASAVAITYSMSVGLSTRVARSNALAWGTLGASALLGGAIMGLRENLKLKQERAKHSRDMAKGRTIDSDMDRRKEMDSLIYKGVSAESVLSGLNIETDEIKTQLDFVNTCKYLSEIAERISVSDRENIDLVFYQSTSSVEKQRLDIDIARAQLKVKLRHLWESGADIIQGMPYGSFDEMLDAARSISNDELYNHSEGIKQKDRLFNKMKKKKVASVIVVGTISGLAIGTAVQEAVAILSDDKVGMIENLAGISTDKEGAVNTTMLEGVRRSVSGIISWFTNEDGSATLVSETQTIEVSPDSINLVDLAKIEADIEAEARNEFGPYIQEEINKALKAMPFQETEDVWGQTDTSIKGIAGSDAKMIPSVNESVIAEETAVEDRDIRFEKENLRFKLPVNADVVADSENPGAYTMTIDGEVVAENLTVKDGEFTKEAVEILDKKSINVNVTTSEVVVPVSMKTEVQITPSSLIDENAEAHQKIHRDFWYDNDTKKFDKNELKLHWGGENGTGVDKDGNYVYSVENMTKDCSYFKNNSIDIQEQLKSGNMKILLSLSRDTQFEPVVLQIDESGKVIIDPDSYVGKTFFKLDDNGQLQFIGKFAEVGHSTGPAADGVENFRVLATDVGKGIESYTTEKELITGKLETIKETSIHFTEEKMDLLKPTPNPVVEPIEDIKPQEPEEVPIVENIETAHGDVQDYNVEPPMYLPILGRTPLEKLKRIKNGAVAYDYGLVPYAGSRNGVKMANENHDNGDFIDIDAEIITDIDTLTITDKNENLDTDKLQKINEYLERQTEVYAKELEDLIESNPPMIKECKLSVCIPVNEYVDIYQTLENFKNQNADKDSFEIVLYINTLTDTNGVQGLDILNQVEKFKQENPEIRVVSLQKNVPAERSSIGNMRKTLTDAVLKRAANRGEDREHYILSNNAGGKGMTPLYISNFIKKFEDNPEFESFVGQTDLDPKTFVENSMLHVAMRFFQYVSSQLNRENPDNLPIPDESFAFKSSTYATVNGYDPENSVNQSASLTKAIVSNSSKLKNKKPIGYAGSSVSRSFVSLESIQKTIEDGLQSSQLWKKSFGDIKDTLFKESLGIKGVQELEKSSSTVFVNKSVLKKDLEEVLNKMIDGLDSNPTNIKLIKRSLSWLGITYTLKQGGAVEIKNIDRLVKGLIRSKVESYRSSEKMFEELYSKAEKFVIEEGKASASMIQRKFRVGYSEASALIERLEERGIVSGKDGSKPRNVLVGSDGQKKI